MLTDAGGSCQSAPAGEGTRRGAVFAAPALAPPAHEQAAIVGTISP